MTTREQITLVAIDVDWCSRTYGQSPCTASLGDGLGQGDWKCFNTWFTCQDRPNFGPDTLTLLFGENVGGRPAGVPVVLPGLRRVRRSPATINPGYISRRSAPLGRRESVSVQLVDFPYDDRLTDKYVDERRSGVAQRDRSRYEPVSQGTFWTRWRARNPYHYRRRLRVYEGEAGQALDEMTVYHYLIDRLDGPDQNGAVNIVAKDVLKLAEDDKALCPAPNVGILQGNLDATATTFDLVRPSYLGDAPADPHEEYGASGLVSINEEIMTFTRAGARMTVVRGMFGTEADEHEAGDKVQLCYRAVQKPIREIVRELLVDFAGIPEAFIDDAEWAAEEDLWLQSHTLNAIIPEPTGVTTLLGELAEIGPYIWWDAQTQKIRFRAVHPELAANPVQLTDDNGILTGSRVVERPQERVSKVWMYYDLRNPFEFGDDPEDYHKLRLAVDLEAEGEREYAQEQNRFVFSRWLGPTEAGLSLSIAGNLIDRSRDVPIELQLLLDSTPANQSLRIGDVVGVQSDLLTDDRGLPLQRDWLILAAEERGPTIALTMREADYLRRERPGSDFETPRFGYIMADGAPDYGAATDEQRLDRSAWISRNDDPATPADETGTMPDDTTGWVII